MTGFVAFVCLFVMITSLDARRWQTYYPKPSSDQFAELQYKYKFFGSAFGCCSQIDSITGMTNMYHLLVLSLKHDC